MFKFQHSLFEALLSAIHPEDFSRDGIEQATDARPRDILRQECFLYHKYQEFSQSEQLAPLIKYSEDGDTDEFIQYFNSLEIGFYALYKISLYDIN
jgi:hypothetical protein